jgi:Putative transposase
MRLEILGRYPGHPPVATDGLSPLPDGKLLYRLKRRWRHGTIHVIFEHRDLATKFAAPMAPPRFNLLHFVLGIGLKCAIE